MPNTVVGVFNSPRTAQQVVQDLARQGIARESIHLTETDRTAEASSLQPDEARHGIRGFFKELFSTDDYEDELREYAAAVRGGAAVVAVDVEDDKVGLVEQALTSAGARDVGMQGSGDEARGLDALGADSKRPELFRPVEPGQAIGTDPSVSENATGRAIPEADAPLDARVPGVRVFPRSR